MSGIVERLTQEAQTHPLVERLTNKYPYTKAQIAAVYVTCRGDEEAVEAIVRLSIRPVGSDLVASILDMLRENT